MRHARSLADDENKHEGRYDSPLTDVGRKQVRMRALKWKEENMTFDAIISSTLIRAKETASIIAKELDCEVMEDDLWMEMDNGVLAGLRFEEAAKKYPMPNFQNPYDRKAHGTGESLVQLHARAAFAIESVLQRRTGRYLIVSHGGTLNAVMRSILQMPIPINESGHFFKFGDAGFIKLTYLPERHFFVVNDMDKGF